LVFWTVLLLRKNTEINWVLSLNKIFSSVFPTNITKQETKLPDWSVVGIVQLELDFLDEAGHVLVEEGLDVDRPVVSVTVRLAFFRQKLRVASENKRFRQRNSANSHGLRRIEVVAHFEKLLFCQISMFMHLTVLNQLINKRNCRKMLLAVDWD
jgi:hypothetical protein